jgi:hypothetical protein
MLAIFNLYSGALPLFHCKLSLQSPLSVSRFKEGKEANNRGRLKLCIATNPPKKVDSNYKKKEKKTNKEKENLYS